MSDSQQYLSFTFCKPQLSTGSWSQSGYRAPTHATGYTTGEPHSRYVPGASSTSRLANHKAPSQPRVSMACTNCRRRKIKCSGDKNGCSACVRLEKHCEFVKVPTAVNDALRDKKRRSRERKEAEQQAAAGWKQENRVRAHAMDRCVSDSGNGSRRSFGEVGSGSLPTTKSAGSSATNQYQYQRVFPSRPPSLSAAGVRSGPGSTFRRESFENSVARLAATRPSALSNGFTSTANVATSPAPALQAYSAIYDVPCPSYSNASASHSHSHSHLTTTPFRNASLPGPIHRFMGAIAPLAEYEVASASAYVTTGGHYSGDVNSSPSLEYGSSVAWSGASPSYFNWIPASSAAGSSSTTASSYRTDSVSPDTWPRSYHHPHYQYQQAQQQQQQQLEGGGMEST